MAPVGEDVSTSSSLLGIFTWRVMGGRRPATARGSEAGDAGCSSGRALLCPWVMDGLFPEAGCSWACPEAAALVGADSAPEAMGFSKTAAFSDTSLFSEPRVFPGAGSFSEMLAFSETDLFPETVLFSNTAIFSNTDTFSGPGVEKGHSMYRELRGCWRRFFSNQT